ncbi:hypothetical protein D3C80_1557480 [compost metagenome]
MRASHRCRCARGRQNGHPPGSAGAGNLPGHLPPHSWRTLPAPTVDDGPVHRCSTMPKTNARRYLRRCPTPGSRRHCQSPGTRPRSWKHHAARVRGPIPGPDRQPGPDSWPRRGCRRTTTGHRRYRPRGRARNDLVGLPRAAPRPARRSGCPGRRPYRWKDRQPPGGWSQSVHRCHAGSVPLECFRRSSAGCRWRHPGQ